MYQLIEVRIELAYAKAGAAFTNTTTGKYQNYLRCSEHELLTCGIEKIDSILKLTSGDRLAIIGNQKYTQMLIAKYRLLYFYIKIHFISIG